MRLSRRLPWSSPENPLARLQTQQRATGVPLLDLTVANPTTVGLVYPADDLAAALAPAGLTHYRPAALGLFVARAAVAADHARRGVSASPDCVAITASSSESYSLLFKMLCDPGDVVLVPQPSYPLFDHLAALDGLQPRPYRLFFDGQWHIDSSSLDPAGARVLVVVNPNNPTGSFISAADLQALGDLARRHDLSLIVDEVFADYPGVVGLDAVRTVAACPPPGVVTFVLGGLSKGSGLPQLKLGWLTAFGPDKPVRHALGALELVSDAYLSAATPVQLGLPRLLELGAGIRSQIAARVARNRAALATRILPSAPCTLLPAEGGWSAIVRVPQTLSDEDWACRLLVDDGVLVQPGYFFDLSLGATLVVSLLTDPATFDEGCARLVARIVAMS